LFIDSSENLDSAPPVAVPRVAGFARLAHPFGRMAFTVAAETAFMVSGA